MTINELLDAYRSGCNEANAWIESPGIKGIQAVLEYIAVDLEKEPDALTLFIDTADDAYAVNGGKEIAEWLRSIPEGEPE